jgi:hypothetical protein
MKILLVDQFSATPTPYELSIRPMKFDEFVAQELERDQHKLGPGFHLRRTQLLEVNDDYEVPFATTAFREASDGTVEVWRYRWDTSG